MKIYKTLENNIKIVEYSHDLAAAVAEMWNQSNDSWGGGTGIRTANQIVSDHSSMSYYNVYIAMDGEEAVGYCSLARSYFDMDTLYIPLLGVRPDYQGKKVGKALVLQCVERTIELGYPRTDIHTWSGNTQAVPLYKKCGYLWEDRENTTYLINFVPEILKLELFADFFENVDWYADSKPNLEIEPDGVKINKFETFGYLWQKNNEMLAVGYERSGKRIRLIETNDYKIEFMADSHEPAFGMKHNCTFIVENKTGKELQLEIKGKNDGNITFDFHEKVMVDGTKVLAGKFFVNPTYEHLDTWRIHPCVLADVIINGCKVEFGLGINSKVPIELELIQQHEVPRIGATYNCYFNLKSALNQDATVSFNIPRNDLNDFSNSMYSAKVLTGEKANVKANTTVKAYGHVEVPVNFKITFEDSTQSTFEFEYPLHIVNQNLTHAFSYEGKEEYCIVNGPWSLHMKKHDSQAYTKRLLSNEDNLEFDVPKLGMPFTAEFDTIKPSVKMFPEDQWMVMEAEFESNKFRGMILVVVHKLSATGIFTRNYRLRNISSEDKNMAILDFNWLPADIHTVFPYDKKILQNIDGRVGSDSTQGSSDIDPEKFDENWLFEGNPRNSFGVCWHPSYKPIFKWAEGLLFEIDCGTLSPGQEFETHPVEVIFGVFHNYNTFRNYALNLYDKKDVIPDNSLQLNLNAHNPFVYADKIKLVMENNRLIAREGVLKISSCNTIVSKEIAVDSNKTIMADELDLCVDKQHKEICVINVELNLLDFVRRYERVIFPVDGKQNITVKEADGVLTVTNNRIEFRAAPSYSDALFSLTSRSNNTQNHWLFSRYPVHEPYAWSSPFIGGLQSRFANMSNNLLLKEHIEGDFVDYTDNLGNIWQGICTKTTVKEYYENKGATIESYYLTIPGSPIVCHFFKVLNNTGIYKEEEIETSIMLGGGEILKDMTVQFSSIENISYDLKLGTAKITRSFNRLIRIDNKSGENMYVYKDDPTLYISVDSKAGGVYSNTDVYTENGCSFTSKPLFLITTNCQLAIETLEDLRRIRF